MKEEEIRKRDALDRYLELVRDDCRRILTAGVPLEAVACPACGHNVSTLQFTKEGFEYATCDACATLFARTRPSFDSLQDFYARSSATDYWINEFFKPVAETRREKIFRPRAEYVATRFGSDPAWVIGDIGAGFGLFAQELRSLWPASRYIAIEPSPEQAELCTRAGLEAVCRSVEEMDHAWNESFDLLTAFELLEHVHTPGEFVRMAGRLLKPGGRLLATTLNGEGFDIQILWDRSKNVYPPCHLNFLNPASLTRLLTDAGFVVEDLATPGRLDWDIVEGMIASDRQCAGRLWELVARKGSAAAKQELQTWISCHGLSSHMRVLARKA